MTLALANDIWGELKRYVGTVDKAEAAEVLVNILIDNDFDAEEIKEEFKGDTFVRQALSQYIDDDVDHDEYDEYNEDLDEY